MSFGLSRKVDMQQLIRNEISRTSLDDGDNAIADARIAVRTLEVPLAPIPSIESVDMRLERLNLRDGVVELTVNSWLGAQVLENKILTTAHVSAGYVQHSVKI